MDCSICYESADAKTNTCTLACSHSFHLGCMMKWMKKSETCPLCRKEIEKEEPPKKTYKKMNGFLIAEEDIDTVRQHARVSRGMAIRALQLCQGDLDDAMYGAMNLRDELLDTPLTPVPGFREPSDEQRAYWGLHWLFDREVRPGYLTMKELKNRHVPPCHTDWIYEDWSTDLTDTGYYMIF